MYKILKTSTIKIFNFVQMLTYPLQVAQPDQSSWNHSELVIESRTFNERVLFYTSLVLSIILFILILTIGADYYEIPRTKVLVALISSVIIWAIAFRYFGFFFRSLGQTLASITAFFISFPIALLFYFGL